jgi:hypothetical protein
LLLDKGRIINLIRSRGALCHVLHSGLSCLARMEFALRLRLIQVVRVPHVDEVELFEFGGGEGSSVKLRLGERSLRLQIVVPLPVVIPDRVQALA